MPFRFGLFAGFSLQEQVAMLSLREQVAGLTLQEQINKCREMEAEARRLASGESSEKREGYLHLADRWANLADDLERDYYVRET